jgi:two-component system, OmpR family, sensor histidine kinase MtrB
VRTSPRLLSRLPYAPELSRLRRALIGRAATVAGSVRRAWRRSLQLRMVVITLVISGLLVGAFGALVGSLITRGLVDYKVSQAGRKVSQGAQIVQQQLSAGPSDTRLSNTVQSTLQSLARTPAQGTDVIVAIWPTDPAQSSGLSPKSSPDVTDLARLVPADLRETVGKDNKIAHSFVTYDNGGGSRKYLVYGTPVHTSVGDFQLYYAYPLDTEERAAGLVRSAVVGLGALLVIALSVLAALTTRLVVTPVRIAARTAQRLSAGLLDQRMAVRGEDDLALLGASFNQMAENLQRQIGQLEEMSRLQRRFTSDVSHELRTPLTTVRMAADLIFSAREDFDPAVARSAELLQNELDRFEGLLTDLLEISRFDAGFAVLDAEPTDLVPIVERVTDRLTSLARRCGVELVVETPEPPVIAEVDQRRVERILRNLVGNAVEHGECRPVEVRLGASETAVAITVRDHGIGLKPGEEKLVFNRFWRADPSRARQTGGTGLGLSISVEDARLHGGWLEAWGSPGEGAQFRLTLPVRAGDRLTSAPLRLVPEDAVVVGRRPSLPTPTSSITSVPAPVLSIVARVRDWGGSHG